MTVNTKYSAKLFDEVCSQFIGTSLSLAEVCRNNPDYPTRRTMYNWMRKYPEAMSLYLKCKEIQMHYIAEELLELSDCKRMEDYEGVEGFDLIARQSKDFTNKYVIERNKLQIDARKFLISKLNAHVYGNAMEAKVEELRAQVASLKDLVREKTGVAV